MKSQLKEFSIYGLWGDKEVHLSFKDNCLILVGENGSGKTTILRMVYETLACRWAMLSLEDFSEIRVMFTSGKTISISKSKLKKAKDLFIDADSDIIQKLPMPLRRALREQSSLSGRDVSYDQIQDIISEYDYYDEELQANIREKIQSIEDATLTEYSKVIKGQLSCNVIYLPTYRRIEKKIGYINEKEYRRGYGRYTYRNREQRRIDNKFLEVAKTGMDDVDYFIRLSIDEIRRKADITASRLNYQCFKGILNKSSEDVEINEEILTQNEIKNVFGSINENVLSSSESNQIQTALREMGKDKTLKTYDSIVYYYYSMLHQRYLELKKSEEPIVSFFEACNAYLVNKRFIYDEKEYTYSIIVSDGAEERDIKIENLSSGEKQVVSIFSYLYLSSYAETLVLIDEPELSLSVQWQERFLLDIAKGIHCAGVISTTHSPFVFDNELKKYAHALSEYVK